MKEFPHIPSDLLDALEQAFPDRTPSKTESYEDIRVRIGHREVINFLKARQRDAEDFTDAMRSAFKRGS